MGKFSEEECKKKCEELDVEYVGYYKTSVTVVRYICKKHRDKGIQEKDWGHFRNQKKSCPYCSGRYKTTEEAQSMVLNPNIRFISEYKGAEKPVKCECNKCGNVWITNRPMDLFRRKCGCPECSKVNKGLHRRKTQEEFVNEMKVINPDIEIIGEYTGTHKYVKCRCKKDGYVWESHASNLRNGSAGCPICNGSVGEKNIVMFMEKNGISYERQKTFDGCRLQQPLKFDVYDIDNNIAIEFQGEQHYIPVDFENNDPEAAKVAFGKQMKRDSVKREYCKDNGITLVCIPYWERSSVGRYLIDNVEIYKEKYGHKK